MGERVISVKCPNCGREIMITTTTYYTEFQTIGCQFTNCNKFFAVKIRMNPTITTYKLEEVSESTQ